MKKLLCIILAAILILTASFSTIAINDGNDDSEENIGDLLGYYTVTYIDGENQWFEYYEANAEINYDSLTAKRGSDYTWSLSAEEYIAPPKSIGTESITVYAYDNPVMSFENYAYDPGQNYAIKSMMVRASDEMAYSGYKSLKLINAQYAVVSTEPGTWATNYNNYYTLVDGVYVKNSYDEAPDFNSKTFYEARSGQREHSAVLGKIEASVTYKISFRYYIKEALNSNIYLTAFTGHSNLWAAGEAATGLRVDYSNNKYTISTNKEAGQWHKGNIYFTASEYALDSYNNLYVWFTASTANNYDVIYFDDFSVEEAVLTTGVIYHYNNGVDEDKIIAEGVTVGMTLEIDHIPENIPEGKYFMGWYSDEELTTPITKITVPTTSDNGDFSAHVYAKYGDYKSEHTTVYNGANIAPVGYGYMLNGNYSNTITEGGWATVNFKADGVHFTKNANSGQAGIFDPTKTDGLTQYTGKGYITPNKVTEDNTAVGEIANIGWGVNSSYALKDAEGNMLIAKPNTTYAAIVTYELIKEGSCSFTLTAGRPTAYINSGANDIYSYNYSSTSSKAISLSGKTVTGENETAMLTFTTGELTDCLPVISIYGTVVGYRARRIDEDKDGNKLEPYTYTDNGVTYTAYPYEIIDVPEFAIKEIKLIEVGENESAVAYNYYTQGEGFSGGIVKGEKGSALNLPSTNSVDNYWYTDKEAFDRYESDIYPESSTALYNAEYLINHSNETLSGYNVSLYAGSKGLSSATVEKDGEQVHALKYKLYGYDEYATLFEKDYNDKELASTESEKVERMNAALVKGANMFRLGKVSDGHTYKVSFYYKAEEMNTDLVIAFATAHKNNAYLYKSSIKDYTISKTDKQGWNLVSFYITADLGGSVSDIAGGDDNILSLNYEELYVSFAQTVTKSDLSGENNTIYFTDINVVDLGKVIEAGGASVLTENAALATENQALRYYFNYNTVDGATIVLDGKPYTITERGFIYKNGAIDKYAPNSLYLGGMTVGATGVIIEKKNNNFNYCWEYKDGTMTFSTYINGFTEEKYDYDLIIRGYITFTDENGISHTIYSDTVNRSVNYVKDGGDSVVDTSKRYLVWSAGIEGASSVADLNDLHQDTNASTAEGRYDHYDVVKGGDNWIIEDGAMILRIDYADDYTDENKRYTMAKCLNTKNQMSFKYGYMEIDAELPFAYGSWLGYWTRPQYEFDAEYKERVGNNHEFDIFEVFGLTKNSRTILGTTYYYGDPIARVKPNLHKWFSLDGGGSTSVQIGGGTTQFTDKTKTFMVGEQGTAYSFGTDLTTARQRHRYGFEWTEEYVAMYVDPVVVNGVPISEPYWKINIELENDYWLDEYEKSKGMQCFHEEAYLCLSNAVITSANTFIYEGNYADNLDIIAENGGKPIDYKIYSCKLYQRAGETIDYH